MLDTETKHKVRIYFLNRFYKKKDPKRIKLLEKIKGAYSEKVMANLTPEEKSVLEKYPQNIIFQSILDIGRYSVENIHWSHPLRSIDVKSDNIPYIQPLPEEDFKKDSKFQKWISEYLAIDREETEFKERLEIFVKQTTLTFLKENYPKCIE